MSRLYFNDSVPFGWTGAVAGAGAGVSPSLQHLIRLEGRLGISAFGSNMTLSNRFVSGRIRSSVKATR